MSPISPKESIPYSQALRLNRICSNNAFFDQTRTTGYISRDIRKYFFHPEENKLTFNITCYPKFQNTKTILEELQRQIKSIRKYLLKFLL